MFGLLWHDNLDIYNYHEADELTDFNSDQGLGPLYEHGGYLRGIFRFFAGALIFQEVSFAAFGMYLSWSSDGSLSTGSEHSKQVVARPLVPKYSDSYSRSSLEGLSCQNILDLSTTTKQHGGTRDSPSRRHTVTTVRRFSARSSSTRISAVSQASTNGNVVATAGDVYEANV